MSRKKLLKKLLSDPVEMRMDEVINMLYGLGFVLRNTNGSHYNFKHGQYGKLTIPRHNNMVKRWYLKRIVAIIESHNFRNS